MKKRLQCGIKAINNNDKNVINNHFKQCQFKYQSQEVSPSNNCTYLLQQPNLG